MQTARRRGGRTHRLRPHRAPATGGERHHGACGTEGKLAFLKQRLCDQLQGYLFSRPVPAEEFENILMQDGRSEVA